MNRVSWYYKKNYSETPLHKHPSLVVRIKKANDWAKLFNAAHGISAGNGGLVANSCLVRDPDHTNVRQRPKNMYTKAEGLVPYLGNALEQLYSLICWYVLRASRKPLKMFAFTCFMDQSWPTLPNNCKSVDNSMAMNPHSHEYKYTCKHLYIHIYIQIYIPQTKAPA